MKNLGEITLKQCLYCVVIFAVSFICAAGVSYFPYHLRTPLMLVIPALSLILSVADTKKLTLNIVSVLWLSISVILCISSLNSYDKSSAMEFGIIFLTSSVFLFADLPRSVWKKIIFLINIFAVVTAVSIIASVFIDNLMADKLWFIMNPQRYESVNQQFAEELRLGAYSGFAGEKAEAAIIMNLGIAYVLSKFFAGNKLKISDVLELALVLVALILTGKRMLFIIPVALFVLLMLISRIKHKFIKFFVIVILGICAILVLSSFIPQMATLYDRFVGDVNSRYYDPFSGRLELWKYSFMMFAENPIFGLGYASYNLYAFYHGHLYLGEMWRYYGHNCYYELLGEVGIIGTVAIIGAMLIALIMTIVYLKNKDIQYEQRRMLTFSFYIQVMFFLYCASANVFYQKEQIFLWFTAIAIMLSIHRDQTKNKRLITSQRLAQGV